MIVRSAANSCEHGSDPPNDWHTSRFSPFSTVLTNLNYTSLINAVNQLFKPWFSTCIPSVNSYLSLERSLQQSISKAIDFQNARVHALQCIRAQKLRLVKHNTFEDPVHGNGGFSKYSIQIPLFIVLKMFLNSDKIINFQHCSTSFVNTTFI